MMQDPPESQEQFSDPRMESTHSVPEPEDAWGLPPEMSDGGAAGSGRRVRGWTWLAWIVILGVAGVMFAANQWMPAPAAGPEDPLGSMMVEWQGKMLLGADSLQGGSSTEMWATSGEPLNLGAPGQRMRVSVLAYEMVGIEEARSVLAELQELIDEAVAAGEDRSDVITEEQDAALAGLQALYGAEGDASQGDALVGLDALDVDQRVAIEQSLGWFGPLALAPEGAEGTSRDQILGLAQTVAFFVVTVFILGALGGFVGLIGLIIVMVLALTGRLGGRFGYGGEHHGVYAETFGLWLLLFTGLQLGAGLVGAAMPSLVFASVIVGFFLSLVALGWPVLRGVPWGQVRRDIGLNFGSTPLLEPFMGVVGYLLTLPMLGVGLILTLGFMAIQGFLAQGEIDALAPAGGPAHPIIESLGGPGWAPKIQILLLAAVAAPIVEEIMFRGVLYRHLRDASHGLGIVSSILFSTIISGFIFAVIHPQGWVAIPALMALATGFVLVREWRGTIVPSIIVHGISNGLMISMVIILITV